jgi:hypothetical protein
MVSMKKRKVRLIRRQFLDERADFFRKKIKMFQSESYQSNSQSRGLEVDISEYECTDGKTAYTFDSD